MNKMKKLLSISLLCASMIVFSQNIKFGVKANVIYNASKPEWKQLVGAAEQLIADQGKSSVGYNIGMSLKVDLPITSLFLMPELYYTTFKSSTNFNNVELTAKSNRVDLPVLLGYNILGDKLGIFAGPVASYNLSTDNQFADFKENATKEFTIGYQLGAQVMISNLILNARYEGAFSKDQREFINSNLNQTLRYDSRPSLFLIGAGVKF